MYDKKYCCDRARSNYGCRRDLQCITNFRVCLLEQQILEPSSFNCTLGSGATPVLGRNSFEVNNAHNPSNPGRIKIPLESPWEVGF